MDEIHDTLQENKLLARKFYRIEKALAGSASPDGLFEQLLTQIEREFSVPYAWISLINNGPLSGVIDSLKESAYLKDRINLIDEAALLDLLGGGASPVLANTDLQPFYKLLPKNVKYFIKSIAIAPLTADGAIAGSLNLGDSSPGRYRPGMDTDLLKRLVNSVSLSLSAILARHGEASTPVGENTGGSENI